MGDFVFAAIAIVIVFVIILSILAIVSYWVNR